MNRSVLARQMFAKGGQAVPNEYKGFSMLPEEVQMKMDPVAAKKYQEGGEIRAGISDELRRDIDRVKAQLIEEEMQKQRRMENITSLQALRNKARYDVPLLGLDDVSNVLPTNEERFDPNNIYNIARFLGENPGTTVSDYNKFFKTNLDPRDFSVLEEKAEPPAVGMAMGGDPAMAQGVGSMMPPPPAMPPAPAPMPTGADMPVEGVDPQQLEGLLANAQQEVEDLDEAEDFETVMNTIRGDEATVEERYEELASVVGEEDARQTPESVLTLVQPAMVMGAVDQGIGGLAQQEMMEPVQGAMAQGIMSTVEPPQPAGGMGGPPPVNFKDGGLVRRGDNQPVQYYAQAGEVVAPTIASLGVTAPEVQSLQEVYESRLPLYKSIMGDPTAQLEEQKKLTKANMLFDIANTALAFAAPMEDERPGMSAAERLAMAARTTKLPQTIGARAQAQLDAEKAVKAQEQQIKSSALSAAEADIAAQQKALSAYKKEELAGALKLSGIGYTKALELDNATKLQKDLYEKKDALQVKIKGLEADMAKASDERKAVLEADLLYARGEQAKVLEGIKQAGREALQNTINTFKEKMNKLDQVQTLEAQDQKAKLDEQLKVLEANMRLTERDLMNAFELEKLDKVHDQATELQNSRLAVQESIASNRLSFDENQAKLNQARADKELAIKEKNLELQQAAEERITVFEQQSIDLKERELEIKEEASALSKFGSGTQARITAFLSDSDRIKAYKDGTMSKDEALEMNTIITLYANPIDVWNEQKQAYVTQKATPLSNEVMDAIRTRKQNDLTVPSGIDIAGLEEETPLKKKKPKEEKPETAPDANDLSQTTFESITETLNVAKGTGPPAAAARAINTAFKTVLPFLNKPFSEQSRAARLIKNINAQATLVYITDFNGRPNVAMQEMIQETLPKAEQWYSTDQDAINAIENTIAAFNSRLQAIDVQLLPASEGGVGGLTAEQKSRLSSQRESLKIIRNAYADLGKDYIGSGTKGKKDKKPIESFIGVASDED